LIVPPFVVALKEWRTKQTPRSQGRMELMRCRVFTVSTKTTLGGHGLVR
jgi:hypothetical protein